MKKAKENSEVETAKDTSDDFVVFQKEDFEAKLSDIKYFKDQEHLLLKDRIRRLEDELSLIKEAQSDNLLSRLEDEEENEKVKTLNIRLSEINNRIHDEIMSHERIIIELRKENDELTDKNRSLRATIEKMKTELRFKMNEKETEYNMLKQKLKEKTLEAQEFHNKAKEATKLKKKITELKTRISKLENNRKDLKDMIKEKECEVEMHKFLKDKAINSEKRKEKEFEDKITVMKEEIEVKTRKINITHKHKDRNSEIDLGRYISPKDKKNPILASEAKSSAKKLTLPTKASRNDMISKVSLNDIQS